jgi:hypothetical protein
MDDPSCVSVRCAGETLADGQLRIDLMADRTFEIRVIGLVPTQDLLAELGDVETAEHEFRTVLSGRFADQAALYGFIHKLRSFGLEIVEVRRVPTGAESGSGESRTGEV